MPINFYDSIALDNQEIQDVSLQNLATGSQPSGVSGQIYYNTTNAEIRFYNGAAWIALAAGGGGVTTFTNANGTFVSAGTTNTTATGAVTMGPIDLSATGTANATTFLRGDNTWGTPAGGGSMSSWIVIGDTGTATVSDGETVDIAGGTYITTAVTGGSTPYVATVNHDATSRTDTTSADSPAAGATFTAVDSVTSNATGHVTALNLKTVTLPADSGDTTYALSQAGTTTATIVLTPSSGGTDVVTFLGTANQLVLTGNGSNQILAALPGAILAPGSLETTTTLAVGSSLSVGTTSTFTGIATFTALPTIPQTPTAATDAASKGYVDSVLVGALVFQGGYNASTSAPTGASIFQGFTYVVTTAGNASGFWTTPLEIGDLIIAEQDNPTTESDWTEVNKNIDIATAAATTGTPIIGISGYSSHFFDVDATGFVQTNTGYVASIGNASSVAFVVNHAMGSRDVIVQLYDTTTFDTVFAQVVRTDINNVTVTFSTAPAASGIRCVITKVSNVV